MGVTDTVQAITKLIEALHKLSETVQLMIIGSASIAGGIYLLAAKPF